MRLNGGGNGDVIGDVSMLGVCAGELGSPWMRLSSASAALTESGCGSSGVCGGAMFCCCGGP
jgi:hypothetical protein